MTGDVQSALRDLRIANPLLERPRPPVRRRVHPLQKVLVANRGEIAKRFFFVLKEEDIASVAVVTDPDRKQSWYEFADEVVYIGDARNYTNVPVLLGAVVLSQANAIYPGYGFLAESLPFVDGIAELSRAQGQEIIFLGPPAEVMRRVGNKVDARALAQAHGIPLLKGTELIRDLAHATAEAARIGYPIMVKLNAGGGGKGMTLVADERELAPALDSARRLGQALYGDDGVYLEQYVQRPVHVEVQIFNGMAVGIRKCAVQRRNQKIIEETGDFFLEDRSILRLLAAAESVAAISGYADSGGGAGTVEFLFDAATEQFGFLEINTRLQVEYPVTDQSLSIDLAKWQVLYFDGREREIPYDQALRLRFAPKYHAIECRIYAEDPWKDHAPSPGVIQELDLPTFNGIRCDFGFRKGDTVLPHYDSMIGKLIARGTTRQECLLRLERALGELYIRGITTNVDQLLKIVRHSDFRTGAYTNRLLSDADDLRSEQTDAEQPVDAAAFCALCELRRSVQTTLDEIRSSGDVENVLRGGSLARPSAFRVDVHGIRLRIDLLQVGLETYHVFVNHRYYGQMQVSQRVDGIDDFLILFRGRSYPARIDRRPSFQTLRVMEADGRMHYYRLTVRAVGPGQSADSPGTVRSPFQCSFVRLASDRRGEPIRIGSPVDAGDPLITIEAMKMESVLRAPVSGTVTYLVEDGDPTRLVRGTTSEGLIVGKPLTEGEILVIVGADAGPGPREAELDVVEIAGEPSEVLERLRDPELPDGGLGAAARANPARVLPGILELMRAFYLGYVQDPAIPGQLQRVFEDLRDADVDLEHCDAAIADVVDVYTALKQIYSPMLVGTHTWFGEMDRWVLEWQNETYTPPEFFRTAIIALLRRYGILWTGGRRTLDMRLALVYILRGYSAIRDGRPMMAALLTLLEAPAIALPRTLAAAEKLVHQEQSERDDSLARLGRSVLARAAGAERGVAEDAGETPLGASLDPFAALPGDDGSFRAQARSALKSGEPTVTLPALPAWVQQECEALARRWSSRYRMDPLPSCIPTVLIYRLTPVSGASPRYASLAWLEEGTPVPERDSSGRIVSARNVEAAFVRAGRLLAAYDSLERGEGNIVQVLACERPVVMDLAASDPTIWQYDNLIGMLGGVARVLRQTRADWLLLQSDAQRPGVDTTIRRVLSVSVRHGQPRLDLLQDTDRLNPLWNGSVDDKNQRLFDRRKWPVELWAEASFDPGTARELVVGSIDGPSGPSAVESGGPSAGHQRRAPVAAKIYEGLIAGRPAVFFLKDSRISGGATGDLEGRKYAAACYYAYLKDRPLYVWNDGAGANIRQGMVALNRAAEGFMMNALLAHGVGYERFLSTVRSSADPTLRELFQELDQAFGLAVPSGQARGPRAFFMVAVGVGSSTGLDVYGSSQASIQILLDADESYRVLTGSNVIRAVTGEALTNYDIGGARVMGPWTGTVDLVARDRIDLLRRIRQIHELFAVGPHRAEIARLPGAQPELADTASDTVLNERRITVNVDAGTFLPFKREYAGAGALVGGFARLGGKHVLIMGPRTDAGLRSSASMIRAKELLQTANETRSPAILVVGRRWYLGVEGDDDTAIRARMDFFRLLCGAGAPRLHIVTHPEGLALATLHSEADALIYVSRGDESEERRRLALRTASFQAPSVAAAFDLANRILGLFAAKETAAPVVAPSRRPHVPLEASRPYDMVADVIEPLFDEGSFLEFYRDADGRAPSTLITGFATLNGRLMAAIADQTLGGGGPDAPGTEKFRVFMELLDRRGIPLVMLSNAPGFVPGTKQERLRIQQIGGESLDVNVLSRVPVVSVVLNQNFGGRQIHAFSRFLRPAVAYIALDRAILAVMGGPAAFDLFHGARYEQLRAQGDKEEADRLRNEFLADFTRKSRADQDAMRTGVLDWTVPDVADLRAHVIRAMELAEARARAAFGGDDAPRASS